MKLNAAPLGDGCNTGREAARETRKNYFDGGWSLVLGGKDLRVICLECEIIAAGLLRTQSEEAADHRAAVGAIHPLAGRAPLELRRVRCLLQDLACLKQRTHVNSVLNPGDGRSAVVGSHCLSPVLSVLCSHWTALPWHGRIPPARTGMMRR